MKRLAILLIFLFLVSCVPKPEIPAEEKPAEKIEETKELPEIKELKAKTFVEQVFDDGSVIKYGYTSGKVLVSIDNDGKVTEFFYDNDGRLIKINDIKLEYDKNLRKIGDAEFEFNAADQLTAVKDSQTTYFTYTGDLLSEYKKGNTGAVTSFSYKNKSISEIKKGTNVYALYYNDNNLLDDINFNKDTAHWIIGIGKNNRIANMNGKLFGPGETIDYVSGKIKIMSGNDSEFTGTDEQLRLDALHKFLICTKIKKMPVEFDAIAYAILRSHFNFDLQDYFISNYYCEAFK
ncbi:hypothetical protein KY346_00440 [Candidatus Woesearchaeota archaeon]|nr:hypothetical protein [Candidatus Woesearchaeota archaeon]